MDLIVNGPVKAGIRRARCEELYHYFRSWRIQRLQAKVRPHSLTCTPLTLHCSQGRHFDDAPTPRASHVGRWMGNRCPNISRPSPRWLTACAPCAKCARRPSRPTSSR
eukprot:7318895-Prymnesium_polylepis.2